MAASNATGNTVWDKIYASGGYDEDPERFSGLTKLTIRYH